MRGSAKRLWALAVLVAVAILAVVVLNLPPARRAIGLPTIIVTDIEDDSTENPEPPFQVCVPQQVNSLGYSWEPVTARMDRDGPIIGEWHEARAGLFGTKTVREEVHASWIESSPAVAQLSVPGEDFPFSLGSGPDRGAWREIRIIGYYLDEHGKQYPVEEHTISGSDFASIALREGCGMTMTVDFTGQEGYEYLCIPLDCRQALWQRGRYKTQRGKHGAVESDLRRKRALYSRVSYAAFKRRCKQAPESQAGDEAASSFSTAPEQPRAEAEWQGPSPGSCLIVLRETGGEKLQIFYGGRNVGRSGRAIPLSHIDPEAVLLAFRINNDGTTDFLVDANTPLVFKHDDSVVKVAFERVHSSTRTNRTIFEIHVTRPSSQAGRPPQISE
jgi:hypothetical protein